MSCAQSSLPPPTAGAAELGGAERDLQSLQDASESAVQSQWLSATAAVESLGEFNVELPRVRCQCGGSVQIDFGGVIRPYQRICDDIDEQIQRWGQLCLSLRKMRTELDHLHINALGLRTLNERLHLLQTRQTKLDANDVPPVLKVDAIWATRLRPNGQFRRDRKGRLRPSKGAANARF